MRPGSRESRWPPVITVLALLAAVMLVPGHLRALPPWMGYGVTALVVAPMIAVSLLRDPGVWLRIERGVTFAFGAYLVAASLGMATLLVTRAIESDPGTSALVLLASSVVVWMANVVGFALVYWQLDAGGPQRRAAERQGHPDWAFAQPPAGGQQPAFVDYLFLAFSTATAFSTTDTTPLTHRAKLLMMLEATISLLTLVVVAARAINVLGS